MVSSTVKPKGPAGVKRRTARVKDDIQESSDETQSEVTSDEATSSENNSSSSQGSTDSDEEESESSETESDSEPRTTTTANTNTVLRPPMVIGHSIKPSYTSTTNKPFATSRELFARNIKESQKNNKTKKSTDIEVPAALSKRRRVRRQRPLTICLSHCRYDLVRSMSQRYGLIEVTEDTAWNIYWTDYSVSLERAVEMRRFQMVNHFPGMNEICRKDLLARNLNRMKRVFPEDYNIFPMTWCLPADNTELQSYSQSRRGKTYICKPEMGCQGRGIFLVKNIKDLNPFGRIICQLYIQKPFLIDHLKFDLRIYVLITSCDPLRVYVYREGLARFATAKYRQPTQNNTENSYMHLTNYAVNKFSRDFIDDEESGTKRKLTTVYNWMKERAMDVVTLEKQTDDVIMKTILSAQPILKHHYRTCFPHHDICSACFEILGFDILIDHKMKPYVIEVNHSPSFHTDTQLDHEIKESLLNDTFAMLHLKQIDRVRIEREDRRRVQERLSNKLAEAKSIMEGKNAKNVKGKPVVKEERPKESPPPKVDFNEAQFEWEKEHTGGYRLIYPLEDSEKYDKFLVHNQVSLYQDTAASQARTNLTKAQIDENNMKRQIEEQKRVGGNKSKDIKVRPESPTSGTEVNTKPKKKKRLGKIDDGSGNGFVNCVIVSEEECERVKCLMQRGMLIRSLGIELQVYNLLTFVGNLKKSDHEEFRRKHGFTISANRPPIMSMETALPYPSNCTSNNPSRQELSENEKTLIGELKSPQNRPPNPGGHQTEYLRAKWVSHQSTSTERPVSFNPSTSMFTMRWQADRNLRLNGAPPALSGPLVDTTLSPPLTTFGTVYTALPISQPKPINQNTSWTTGLPTSEITTTISRPLTNKGSPLNRNTKEIQRRYDSKWANALAALRQDSKLLQNKAGTDIIQGQGQRVIQKGPSRQTAATQKWIVATSMPLELFSASGRPGSGGETQQYGNDILKRRPTYPVTRFRSTHNEVGNLGRLLPTHPKRIMEASTGPSLESAAIIFPRRGNNKINISKNGQPSKRNNALGDGELGILRKPGAKSENQVEPEFNRILGKNQVVTYEDTHLALKGFHLC